MARAVASGEIDVLPEADRLEGFPHPRETVTLFGQQQAEEMLARALDADRVHHAWLIAGANGIGKATLAYKCAARLLARDDERDMFGQGLDILPDSATLRKIRAQAHPGLLVIRRGYDSKAKRFAATISIDEVRRIKSFLAHTAEEKSRRVVIVDSADELNANAANALLKSLEEPPERTVFLIVSSMPGRLLATIRSRCRVLAVPPLGIDDLTRAARAALSASDRPAREDVDWSRLAAVAGGSPRRALALLELGGLDVQARIDRVLENLPKVDLRAVHALGDELQGAAQEAKFHLFFDLLQDTLARLIRSEALGAGAERGLAERLIGPARLATFAELWETLARDKADALALNLDRKSLILASFARIEAASRS